jgi:hypothetical protein
MKPKRIVLIWLAGTALLLSGCRLRSPALDVVLTSYPGLETGIYQDLGTWEEVLGPSRTVKQADGGTTIFYWPEEGVVVFTHPLYQGQYRRKPARERKVTSVIIPLRRSIRPDSLPVAEGVSLELDTLLDLGDYPRRLADLTPEVAAPDRAFVDLVSGPFRKTTERVHFRGTEPTSVEIRDTWWLSHYD